ncbi:MAG TPA: MerR family transcriptional regulator [Chakrabartia sp.]|jgi:DNA-binding transcriptional MerR regulator|nr:MerR family transcriptional regulator [Chakrabartia sp.]
MPSEQGKAEGAFLTIGELADELGLPHHILRYWETRFPQLKPLQRAGNRRYYRPQDAELARAINRLLYQEGYTVKGVQKLLSGGGARPVADQPVATADPVSVSPTGAAPAPSAALHSGLLALRARLSAVLAELDAVR